MRLLQFPRHRLYARDLPCQCRGEGCLICEGGLGYCCVCRGAEGSLPTCCPGERMQDVVETSVYQGLCDYDARLGWVQRSNADYSNQEVKRWVRRT